jgi:hypothetical protein
MDREAWIELKRFPIPWIVEFGNKKFTLNLNQYRNAHYFVLNEAKKTFCNVMGPACIPDQRKIKVKYIIHRKGKKRLDTMNIVSVVDKFFLDYLVGCGSIPDDTCDFVVYDAPEVQPAEETWIEAIVYGLTSNSKTK